MRIGPLDQRVLLYSVAQTQDAAGGLVDTAAYVGEAWARVIALKGEEALKAAQVKASRSIRLQLRWRADVETTWQVDWNGDRYDIVDVDRSLRRDGELWLTAVLRSGA